MAGKRGPTSDLNHNNWDQEEEPEMAGTFREASESELKSRVIKKARRRITDSTAANDDAPKSIFGGFTGFAKKTADPTPTDVANKSASLFSFLSKIPAAAGTASSMASSTQSSSSLTTTTTSPSTALTAPTKTQTNFTFGKTEPSKDEAYYAKVIKLNQSFCEWIKKHVDEQPLCNLISTFKDYEKYWEQLNQEKQSTTLSTPTSNAGIPSTFSNINKIINSSPAQVIGFGTTTNKTDSKNGFSFGVEKSNGSAASTTSPLKPPSSNGSSETAKFGTRNLLTAPKTDDAPTTATSKPFSFGIKTDEKPAGLTAAPSTSSTAFSFGLKKDAPAAPAPAPAATTPFSFGLNKTDKPATSGFSFTAGSVPFSFGNIKPPESIAPTASKEEDEEKDDEDDEPPKVEMKEIVEEDAVYTKKCKIFVKKDNAYKDFGIGMLYLKPVEGSSKTQLLVRSSALGKILINTLLAEGTPVQRAGKNNVMIIYPNAEGENQTNLIRVKDASEADELLENINKYKK